MRFKLESDYLDVIEVVDHNAKFLVASEAGQGVRTSFEDYRLINRGGLVIDVRKPEEYAAGHIVNARNVALDSLQKGDDVVKKQKDKILLTVCETGQTAGRAADLLRRAGYANVFNIRGGLATWRSENLPLVKS